MEFQKYSSFVKPSDVSTLNRMYVDLVTATGSLEGFRTSISEFLFGQKDVDFDDKVLRNTVFSHNQIKFIELVESLGETVLYRLNKYYYYEPWISIICPADIEKGDEPFCTKFKKQTREQGIHCVQEDRTKPLRGLYNGKWEDFVNIIAVQ